MVNSTAVSSVSDSRSSSSSLPVAQEETRAHLPSVESAGAVVVSRRRASTPSGQGFLMSGSTQRRVSTPSGIQPRTDLPVRGVRVRTPEPATRSGAHRYPLRSRMLTPEPAQGVVEVPPSSVVPSAEVEVTPATMTRHDNPTYSTQSPLSLRMVPMDETPEPTPQVLFPPQPSP